MHGPLNGGWTDTLNAVKSGQTLLGGGGNDTLNANASGTTVFAGQGDDTVNVNAAKAVVYGGAANNTINLGDTAQTRIVLQQGGVDQINGFNLHNDDVLDFSTLLAETRVSLADLSSLSSYLQVSAAGADATLSYNPAGLAAGGGTAVAVLHSVRSRITFGTLISDNVPKIS